MRWLYICVSDILSCNESESFLITTVATRMAHGTIGQIEPFDRPTYVEQLEQYFQANNIANAKKVVTLLTVVGSKTYSLMRDLLTSAKPAEKSFNDIIETVRDHLNPKLLAIAECFKFHQRTQK